MLKKLKNMLIIFVIVFLILFFISRNVSDKPDWKLDHNGLVKYPQDRGKIELSKILLEETETYTLERVIYKSRGDDIYGLLYLPKGGKNVPALVMLPGANGPKENHKFFGEMLAPLGYAFLTIDQRGIGETNGEVLSMEADFNRYARDEEPFQHLTVYDVLKAFDVLREQDIVNKEKIIVGGESMGARSAIIAAAIEPRIKGVMAFSASGFGLHPLLTEQQKFMASINPDFYIDGISPRRFVLFHSVDDTVIPFMQARTTFDIAKETKRIIIMGAPCDHGYCERHALDFLEMLGWALE